MVFKGTCRWGPGTITAEVDVGHCAVLHWAVILSIILKTSGIRNLLESVKQLGTEANKLKTLSLLKCPPLD